MSQDKWDAVFPAQIGDPILGKHALDPNDDFRQEREDDFKEYFGICPDIFVQYDFADIV